MRAACERLCCCTGYRALARPGLAAPTSVTPASPPTPSRTTTVRARLGVGAARPASIRPWGSSSTVWVLSSWSPATARPSGRLEPVRQGRRFLVRLSAVDFRSHRPPCVSRFGFLRLGGPRCAVRAARSGRRRCFRRRSPVRPGPAGAHRQSARCRWPAGQATARNSGGVRLETAPHRVAASRRARDCRDLPAHRSRFSGTRAVPPGASRKHATCTRARVRFAGGASVSPCSDSCATSRSSIWPRQSGGSPSGSAAPPNGSSGRSRPRQTGPFSTASAAGRRAPRWCIPRSAGYRGPSMLGTSREQAVEALTSGGVSPCLLCRRERELGVLD